MFSVRRRVTAKTPMSSRVPCCRRFLWSPPPLHRKSCWISPSRCSKRSQKRQTMMTLMSTKMPDVILRSSHAWVRHGRWCETSAWKLASPENNDRQKEGHGISEIYKSCNFHLKEWNIHFKKWNFHLKECNFHIKESSSNIHLFNTQDDTTTSCGQNVQKLQDLNF